MYLNTCVIFLSVSLTHCAPIAENKLFLEDILHEHDPTSVDFEMGKYFEGDMLLNPMQRNAILNEENIRNGLKGTNKRWPNRTVVFHIEEDDFGLYLNELSHNRDGKAEDYIFSQNEEEIEMIKEAMADIEKKSCIKFRAKEKNEHAVHIQGSKNGCFSNVGFSTDEDESGEHEETDQVLNLSSGCFRIGTVVHEMLHTLGFYHMQSTYDRDDFVEIVWENIKAGTEHNFAKYTNDTVTDFGVSYDYGSVIHYPETAFSKNGNKTIIPLKENVKIGQRAGMSESDVLKLNKMYCDESKQNSISYMRN